MVAISIHRDQILNFRLASQNLDVRLPPGSLPNAAGACGIQNTPPGTAVLALNARVSGISTKAVEQALTTDKTFLQAWSLRAAPYIFPTNDAPVFTTGLLPSNEEEIRAFLPGVRPALEKIGISGEQVIRLTDAALLEILDGRTLTKDELGIEIARWCLPHLKSSQKEVWKSASWYAPGQSLGESVARFALPVLALQGLCCHADRRDGKAYLARADQWLTNAVKTLNPEQARGELVRRYLRCYGPSTPQQFAVWAGISTSQADQSWKLVDAELIEINSNGQVTWQLQGDLERLRSSPAPKGVRFLPPHDPLLTLRDRETLIQERDLQKQVWKHAGNPGILLVDGRVAGLWRRRKNGHRLEVTVEQLRTLPQAVRSQVEAESQSLAPLSGSRFVQINFKSNQVDSENSLSP